MNVSLTVYEALLGEIEPYTPSPLMINKALADVGVADVDKLYDSTGDKLSVAKAAISVLKKMVVLNSDSLGKSSQSYDVSKLNQRIKALCVQNGLDVSEYVDELSSISDGSNYW